LKADRLQQLADELVSQGVTFGVDDFPGTRKRMEMKTIEALSH